MKEQIDALWFCPSCKYTSLLKISFIDHVFCYINESILNLFCFSLQSWPLTSYFSQLLKSNEGPLLRRRRNLDSSKPYITAKLLSLPTTFTLGDKKNYNGFYNKPLNTDQEYLSFVMAVLQNNDTDSTANYVRLTYTQQRTYRLHFKERQQLQYLQIYTLNKCVYLNILLDLLIKNWIYVTRTQGFRELCDSVSALPLQWINFSMLWCHVHTQQQHQRSASMPPCSIFLFYFFLWCFSFLSGGLVHSSKNTNIVDQLSMGPSGVNFTAGRTKAYNCSGIVCYPGHAYSVAGPWASAPCPKPNPQLFTCFFLYPHSILFLFIPACCFPSSHFLSTSFSSVERAEEID